MSTLGRNDWYSNLPSKGRWTCFFVVQLVLQIILRERKASQENN